MIKEEVKTGRFKHHGTPFDEARVNLLLLFSPYNSVVLHATYC